MANFKIHTSETAPEATVELLDDAKKNFGFVPNLFGTMAESPNLLSAYKFVGDVFASNSFTPEQRNVVWLTINYENNCTYCVPGHTGIAKSQGVSDEIIEALREGQPLADAKLEALRVFTREMVVQRGHVTEDQIQALFAHGYDNTTVLDVILGLAHKTMSNYTNHVAKTPVDEAFSALAWTHPKDR